MVAAPVKKNIRLQYPSRRILNFECRGPRGNTSDRADITECTCVVKAYLSRVASRQTIRYSYGSNLVVLTHGREAPFPAWDRESHCGK